MIAGDNDQAHRFLNKLLRVAPNHITGLVAFGDTCVKQGNYADAEKNYLHSHHLQPGAIEPLIKLGKLAVITHHLDDAREYFLKAEKISVDNPDIAYNIASVESMSGRLDSAFTWLDKALRLGYVDLHALRTNHELMVVRADRRFEALVSRYFGDSH
jgi:Flp pilus assembly protein TadD